MNILTTTNGRPVRRLLSTLVLIATEGVRGQVASFWFVGAGILIGGAVGAVLAVRIQMTAMPQLVALFNGFGGGASVFLRQWSSGSLNGSLIRVPRHMVYALIIGHHSNTVEKLIR